MTTSEHPKAALRRAADLLDGQAALARACGLPDRRHIWPYFNTDRAFPPDLCPLVEAATGGRVTCEQLRPDVAWHVLRQPQLSDKTPPGETPEGVPPEGLPSSKSGDAQ